MNEKQSFDKLTEEFAQPIAIWQHTKPAKRNAFLLFRDEDAGEYTAYILGNKRAKYPVATAIRGLTDVMRDMPELYGWIRASVRYLEREEKKAAKALKKEDESHGKG